MKKTFTNKYKKSVEMAKRNGEIEKLRQKRNDINTRLFQLKAMNEAMLYSSIIEDAELIVLPFSKRIPGVSLSPDTTFRIDLEMTEQEMGELRERIQDLNGITLPENTDIETYSDLINVLEQITDSLYGDQL